MAYLSMKAIIRLLVYMDGLCVVTAYLPSDHCWARGCSPKIRTGHFQINFEFKYDHPHGQWIISFPIKDRIGLIIHSMHTAQRFLI